MIYIIFILALILWGFTSSDTMFSDSTIGKLLRIASFITVLVCIIIFVIRLFKFIF